MKNHKHKLITISILFTIATGIVYFINRFIFATATLKQMLKSTANNYYHWRFGKIFHKKKGTGSPLLLIHDLTVYSSSYEWNSLIDKLSENHTVYVLDLPGCGRSDKQKLTYTNYLYVQAITDFIKNVIREKTDVITSGFSATFILLACHNENDLFGKILMINPPAPGTLNKAPGKRSKLCKFVLEIPVFGTLIYNMITCQNNIQLLFTEQYLYNPFSIKPEWLDTYYEAAHKGMSNSKYLYSSIIGRYTNNSISHAIKELNNSLYILEGQGEENKQDVLNQYTDYNSAIETFVLKGSKHLPQLESPEQLLEQLLIFLDD